MSGYVPDRLRGVLGGGNPNEDGPSSSPTKTRKGGRKTRPWRVDAASWKQQLQERKAVYDQFALQETTNEGGQEQKTQQETTSTMTTNPSFDQGEQVETVLTATTPSPTKASTMTTTKTKRISASDDDDDDDDDKIPKKSPRRKKSDGSISSSSSTSSKTIGRSKIRRSSPLPRNSTNSTARKSPRNKKPTMTGPSPHETKRIDDFDSNDSDDNNWRNDDELMASRSTEDGDGDIYSSDESETGNSSIRTTTASSSIINTNAGPKKTKVKLLRYGDSSDDAESVGLTSSQENGQIIITNTSTRSSMMEAVEDFIDPSSQIASATTTPTTTRHNNKNRLDSKSKSSPFRMVAAADEKHSSRIRPSAITALDVNVDMDMMSNDNNSDDLDDEDGIISARRSPGTGSINISARRSPGTSSINISARRSPGTSSINSYNSESQVSSSPARRGGRRRPRSTASTSTSTTTKLTKPQLSPATSTTSNTVTVMGNSSYNVGVGFGSNIIRRMSVNGDDGKGNDDGNDDGKSYDTNDSKEQVIDIYDGDEDDWSIRPVPSDEAMCLQKRRWPLRKDNDTGLMISNDDDDDDDDINVNDISFVSTESKKKNKKKKKKGHAVEDNDNHSDIEERLSVEKSPKRKKKDRTKNKKTRNVKSQEETLSLASKSTISTIDGDENDPDLMEIEAMESTASPDPLQKARKSLMLSNLNRSVRNLQESMSLSVNSLQDEDDTICSTTKSIFVPLRPPPGNSSRLKESQQKDDKKDTLKILNNHGVYVSQYNEQGIFVPLYDGHIPQVESPKRYASQYNEHGAFVPINETTTPPPDTKVNVLNLIDSQHNKAAEVSSETAQTDAAVENPEEVISALLSISLQNSTISDNSKNDTDNNVETDTRGAEDPKNDSMVIKEKEEYVDINTEHCVTLPSEENLKKDSSTIDNDVSDGSDVANKVAPSLTESAQIVNASDTDTDPDIMLERILGGPDPSVTEMDGEIRDKEIDDDNNDVDEIDATKILVISDLKRCVGLLSTENHKCIDTIGTSEDPDPVSTALRKKALIKEGEKPSREIVEFKAQLTDTVSSMDTSHHHVIESPGKLKSVKGKKWKERMAINKAAKKKGVRVNEKVESFNINDTASNEEPSRNEPAPCKTDQHEGIQSLDKNNSANIEKSGDNNVEVVEKLSTIDDHFEESKDVNCTEDPMEVEDANHNLHQGDDGYTSGSRAQEISKEVNRAGTIMSSQNRKDTDTADKYSDSTGFTSDGEEQGLLAEELNLPFPENDDVIQGLPPNKGKKWKDRLKKNKNKKQDTTAKTLGEELPSGGDLIEDQSDKALISTPDENLLSIELTQKTTHATNPSGGLEATSPKSEDSSARPSFNRAISDLTAPSDDKLRETPSNDEVCKIEPLVSPKNGGKKSNKWKNRLAKMRVSKSPVHDMKVDGDQQDSKVNETSVTKIPADSNANVGSSPAISPIKIAVPTDCNTQLSDVNKEKSISVDKNQVSSPVLNSAQQHPPDPSTTEDKLPVQSGTTTIEKDSNKKESGVHDDLHHSFTAFDAFLRDKDRPAAPKDDESIYTEMTFGQETMLESTMPVFHTPEDEEQSYMDFTIEESVQPSYVDQTVVSKVAANNQLMSPFMSNLLSSRMFQDVVPTIPLNSTQQQQKQEQNKPTENLDENAMSFPSITVGDYFDDDMTQITMDHLSADGGEVEENYFDAVSKPIARSPDKPITRPPSLKKGKSRRSLNSLRSESASSYSSQLTCSETSKQRIVEILRKEVWSRDVNVIRGAMEDLDTEANNGYQHRAHIVRCGGVMTIMRTMEMNANCESVQVPCCLTLEKLALDPETQVTICEMDGVSLMVKSMLDHTDNVQVQEAACSALATICRQQEADTSQDPLKNAEGAVSTLLSCMARYTTNSRIQAKAFTAITNLCTGSHQRLSELSKAGGIMTLTMALQSPSWKNKNDQHEAISNLSILLRGITELNDNFLSPPLSEEKILESTDQDGTSRTSSDSESMSTKVDDNNNMRQNESTKKHDVTNKGEVADDSYMEDIPDLPIMASNTSLNVDVEEIPDLGQLPTMMSNLEWQSDNKNLDSPRLGDEIVTTAQQRDKGEGDEEEKCIIQ